MRPPPRVVQAHSRCPPFGDGSHERPNGFRKYMPSRNTRHKQSPDGDWTAVFVRAGRINAMKKYEKRAAHRAYYSLWALLELLVVEHVSNAFSGFT